MSTATAPLFSKRWDVQPAPGWDGFEVVPDDAVDFKDQDPTCAVARSLFVGLGGDVAFIPAGRQESDVTPATGYVTVTSGNGVLHTVIDGVDVSVTWATSDAHTAGLIVTAIGAESGLDDVATAEIDADDPTKVNITAVPPGQVGRFSLTVSGTGIAASGATLTGGAGVRVWRNLPDAFIIPMWVRRVLSTGTTASEIEGIT